MQTTDGSKRPATVAEEWDLFAAKVLPADCAPVQRQEMRRAFYSGVAILLTRLLEIGDDDVDEDEGVERLEAMRNEIDLFFLRLRTNEPGV